MLDSVVWSALAVSLTTGVLVLLLLALRPLLGRILSPRFLTALWALLALRLLLPAAIPMPDAAVLFSFSPPAAFVQSAPAEQGALADDATAPAGQQQMPAEEPSLDSEQAGTAALSQPDSAPSEDGAEDSFTVSPSPAGDAAPQGSFAALSAALRSCLSRLSPALMLLCVWGLGAAVRLLFELFFAAHFRRALARASVPLEDPALMEQVGAAADSLGLKKRPAVFLCARIPGPMLVGFLRPVLLLPGGADYPPDSWDCMLRHELTHYRCHHMLYKLMLLLLCCLQWWNPAAYLLRRQADRDLELTCDSWALSGKTADYRARYSRALLDSIAPRRIPGDGCSSCFHREGTRVMKRRLLNVLGKGGRRGSPAALAAGLAVCLLVSSCVVPVADAVTAVSSETDAALLFDSAPPAEIHEISTAEELVAFAEGVNSGALSSDSGEWWVLTDDIDLTGIDWEPIGKVVSPLQDCDFGFYHSEIYHNNITYEVPLIRFDGQGHTVSGLSCFQNSSFGHGGFFFTVAPGSVIRNLHIEGSVTAHTAGGLIARADGLIENCSFSGQVTGYGSVGGLVGTGNATIRYCWVDADVAGSNCVGGFISSTRDCDISCCYATGTVSGYSNLQISQLSGMTYVPGLDVIQEIGGFAGMGAGELTDCIADTTLFCYDASRFLGSFIGTTNTNTVSGCYYNKEKNQNWTFGTIQLRLLDGELFDGPYPPDFRPTTIREEIPGWTPLGLSSEEIAQKLETLAEEYQPISSPLAQAKAIYQPREQIGQEETQYAALLRRQYLDPISCSGALEATFSPEDLSALGPNEERDSLIASLYYFLSYSVTPERIANISAYIPGLSRSLIQSLVENFLTARLPCDAEMLRSLAGSFYDPAQECYNLKLEPPTQQVLARVTGCQQIDHSTLVLDYELYKVPENAAQTWEAPVLAGSGRIALQPYDNGRCRYLSNEYTPADI